MTQVDLTLGVKQLKDVLAAIEDADLDRPTPCPLFSVGNVIAHVGGFARAFTASARKERSDLLEHAPTAEPLSLAADWRTSVPADLDTLAAAWRDPAAWQGMTRIAGMDAPAEMVGQTVADEVVVHAWDLARAIGRSVEIDPELMAAAKGFLTAFTSPDVPAGDGVPFGPPRTAPDGAGPLEQIVALAGRDPAWTPR